MADTPDVLTARINALTQRVATLEKLHAAPPVTQPPATDSPDMTTISPGGTIVFGGKKYTIVGGQAAIDGTVVANTNGVVLLKLVLHPTTGTAPGVYQKNSANNWYGPVTAATGGNQVAGDPSVVPPVVVPPVVTPPTQPSGGIPPQARAAGYITPVLMTEFDNASDVANWTGGGNPIVAPWYTGGEDRYANLGDISIANSILSMRSGGTGFASVISTMNSLQCPTSRPGAPVQNTGLGKCYQYGYFECKMRINSRPGPGWPSWWGTAKSTDPGDHLEIDFMETQATGAGHFNAGFLNWFNGKTAGRAFGQYFGALGATGYPDWNTVSSQSGISTGTPGDWNVFGFLWTPTYIEFYYNSWARRQSGIADYRHSHYPTTTNISGYISNDFGRPITMTLNSGANQSSGMYLILGSAGTDVDWVHVWQ